jgi:hypothetical protein
MVKRLRQKLFTVQNKHFMLHLTVQTNLFFNFENIPWHYFKVNKYSTFSKYFLIWIKQDIVEESSRVSATILFTVLQSSTNLKGNSTRFPQLKKLYSFGTMQKMFLIYLE